MRENERFRRVPTRFGPVTRFKVKPHPAPELKAVEEARFKRLKERLLHERLKETADPASEGHYRQAANEAAALAWITPYPSLVFPVLFDEKARAAELRLERQDQVFQRSREILAL